jgi:hypothetical protein
MAESGGIRRRIGGLSAALRDRRSPCKRSRHRCRPRSAAAAAGPVAQWLEPAAHNGLVAGSSPAGPTSLRSRSERRLPRRSPTGEGGPCGTRATARQAGCMTRVSILRELIVGPNADVQVLNLVRKTRQALVAGRHFCCTISPFRGASHRPARERHDVAGSSLLDRSTVHRVKALPKVCAKCLGDDQGRRGWL